jgi:hypothetical protein
MSADAEARVARRLTARAAPEAWIGLCVRVVPAATREESGGRVQTPDHYLAAAWPPATPSPTRWPEAVVIGSPSATRALDELLRHLPEGAPLYLADLDAADGAFAAEILLAADRNLERYQREAIAAFIATERARTHEAIAARYSDRDPGFERFRTRVLGPRTTGRR